MSLQDVLSAIDAEIDRVQRARDLLTGSGASTGTKKSTNKPAKAKRNLSPEARKRIADAQRKRWAAAKKNAKQS
jgi:hypothetical protein